MKRKKFIVVAVIILLCILILISGKVLGKYISALEATGEAEIARWSFQSNFKNNGKIISNSQIQLQNTYQKDTLIEGKIAPGTSGDFSIEIDGTGSEVAIEYRVEFEEKMGKEVKPTNLRFSLDEGKTYVDSIHDLEETLQGIINADETNKIKTFHILWNWPYETEQTSQNDQLDTQEAEKIRNYAFDIIITGTQVKPQ